MPDLGDLHLADCSCQSIFLLFSVSHLGSSKLRKCTSHWRRRCEKSIAGSRRSSSAAPLCHIHTERLPFLSPSAIAWPLEHCSPQLQWASTTSTATTERDVHRTLKVGRFRCLQLALLRAVHWQMGVGDTVLVTCKQRKRAKVDGFSVRGTTSLMVLLLQTLRQCVIKEAHELLKKALIQPSKTAVLLHYPHRLQLQLLQQVHSLTTNRFPSQTLSLPPAVLPSSSWLAERSLLANSLN